MLLDSSVIVAYFNKEDALHKQAVQKMAPLKLWGILEPILFESITVLQSRGSKTLAKAALDALLKDDRTRIASPEAEDLRSAYIYFITQKGSLTLYDLLLFSASRNKNYPFLSFDKKLHAFRP